MTALEAAARLRRFLDSAGHAMNVAAGWVFVLCAFFVTFDVVARNTLGVSSQSTTELTGYMLAFGIAWGLPHALSARAHVRIDIFLNNVPLRWRQYLHILALTLLAVLAAFLAYGAVTLVLESWDFGATDMSLLRTPLIVPQGLWALGLAAFFALILAMLAEALLRLAAGDSAAIDRLVGTRSYTEEAQEALDAVATARQDGA
jgi:TRAP-type C4-dicarboxylate transport system permease small subunit